MYLHKTHFQHTLTLLYLVHQPLLAKVQLTVAELVRYLMDSHCQRRLAQHKSILYLIRYLSHMPFHTNDCGDVGVDIATGITILHHPLVTYMPCALNFYFLPTKAIRATPPPTAPPMMAPVFVLLLLFGFLEDEVGSLFGIVLTVE